MANSVKEAAEVKADVANIKDSLTEIKGYLTRSAQERTQQYTETVRQVAVLQTTLANVQESVSKYQNECVSDRKAHEVRLEKLENNHATIRGQAAGVSLMTSGLLTIAGLVAAWWHGSK